MIKLTIRNNYKCDIIKLIIGEYMKKIIRCLLFIMLAIPFVINASTYSNEVSKANNYLERESFKNTYNKYILYGSSIPYNNENGELKID